MGCGVPAGGGCGAAVDVVTAAGPVGAAGGGLFVGVDTGGVEEGGDIGDIGVDIGLDTGSPVSNDYASPNPFSGAIKKVNIHLEPAMTNHTDNEQIRKVEEATDLAAQ